MKHRTLTWSPFFKSLSVGLLCSLPLSNAFAQAKPAKAEAGPFEMMNFRTFKKWVAGRWYVVGHWTAPDTIEWLGSPPTKILYPNDSCTSDPGPGKFARNKMRDKTLDQAEILRGEDGWFLIEVSPSVASEEFLVLPASQSTVDPETKPDCLARTPISYAWSKGRGSVRPLLFLNPQSNRFFKKEISVAVPEDEDAEADIQLDLLLGYWKASLPNASASAKRSLNLAPTAVVRGEWLPLKTSWGLTLSLEQTVTNFGGATGQNALFSDWVVGTFFEKYFPFLDSFQVRLGGQYRQHLADDSTDVSSLATPNKNGKYLIGTGTLNLYFAKRWLVGGDLELGFPSSMAGRGVKQSYLSGAGRAGFRVTSSVILLLEGGFRSYKAVGFSHESIVYGQLGVRLDL